MILALPRPSTWRPQPEPSRFRATQRRSLRAVLTVAGVLVAIVSVASGVQFALRPEGDGWALLSLNALQACLGVAVVLAMRTQLRRDPRTIAFVFLLVLPIVPMATLHARPESVVLIAASLALIPIGVALFLPWPGRTFAAWAAGYLLIVAAGNLLWTPVLVEAHANWYLVVAVAIGTVFGVFGQRRRDRQDHLAFARERMLSGLVGQSTRQQKALQVLNAELDRVLGREIQGRESVGAALARIDPAASPQAIAATACSELLELPMVDASWAFSLESGVLEVLAQAGDAPYGWHVGHQDEAAVRRRAEQASSGPWAETETSGEGPAGSIWSPLRGPNGVIGLIGAGTYEPAMADRIAELLPAITTYGSIVGALVAPGLVALHAANDGRAQIRAILDTAAFTPFFQPIVELRTGSVVGYEALTRFENGTRPDLVFQSAAQVGLGIELESATITAAIDAASILGPTAISG